jgi:hypothetical protein
MPEPTPPKPISLSDEQLSMIMAAAEPLHHVDRGPFLEAVADRLRHVVIGDGQVSLICRELQRQFFRAPRETEPTGSRGHKGHKDPHHNLGRSGRLV